MDQRRVRQRGNHLMQIEGVHRAIEAIERHILRALERGHAVEPFFHRKLHIEPVFQRINLLLVGHVGDEVAHRIDDKPRIRLSIPLDGHILDILHDMRMGTEDDIHTGFQQQLCRFPRAGVCGALVLLVPVGIGDDEVRARRAQRLDLGHEPILLQIQARDGVFRLRVRHVALVLVDDLRRRDEADLDTLDVDDQGLVTLLVGARCAGVIDALLIQNVQRAEQARHLAIERVVVAGAQEVKADVLERIDDGIRRVEGVHAFVFLLLE